MPSTTHNVAVFAVAIVAMLVVFYAIAKAIQGFYHLVIRRDRVRQQNNIMYRLVVTQENQQDVTIEEA